MGIILSVGCFVGAGIKTITPLGWFNTSRVTVTNNGYTVTSDGTGADSWFQRNPWSDDISINNVWSFSFNVSNNYNILGVAKTSKTDNDFIDIDYAFSRQETSDLFIYENGALGFSVGATANGDILKISSDGVDVKYYLNGVLKYTSLTAPTNNAYKIKVDFFRKDSNVLTVLDY